MYLNVVLKDSGTGAGNIETTLVIVKGLCLINCVNYCYFTQQVLVNEHGNIIIMCTRVWHIQESHRAAYSFPTNVEKN